MLKVDKIVVESHHMECPYCGGLVESGYGDPRGEEIECESCNRTFSVSTQVDFEVW